ncbi:hypothetical protein WJX82_010696 [Trebouxia sp. C0006]
MLKTNKATASVGAVCCCSVFQALLPINRLNCHKSIAVKLAGSGIVMAVLASLSISRDAANKAVDFFELLLSPKLPAELVDSTEVLLVRMQAVTRLANLLCPPFPCKDGLLHKKVVKAYHRDYYKESGNPVPRMTNVAKIINRLLMRSPAPSDPTQALPTPTPAAWEFIELAHDKLDVAHLMRSCLLPLLKNWAPVHDAAKPLKSLGFAYVRRLGRDTSILALTLNPEAHAVKEQLKEKGKGKGKAKRLPKQQKVECHGCDDCYDVDWEFKVKTVAKLWSMFCYQASTCPKAAAVTVDALHAAMVHEELCKHLLLGTHQVEQGHGTPEVQLGFATAIRNLQGHLTAQLTAAACWARLYAQALVWIHKGLLGKDAWCGIDTADRTCANQVLEIVQAAVLVLQLMPAMDSDAVISQQNRID